MTIISTELACWSNGHPRTVTEVTHYLQHHCTGCRMLQAAAAGKQQQGGCTAGDGRWTIRPQPQTSQHVHLVLIQSSHLCCSCHLHVPVSTVKTTTIIFTLPYLLYTRLLLTGMQQGAAIASLISASLTSHNAAMKSIARVSPCFTMSQIQQCPG